MTNKTVLRHLATLTVVIAVCASTSAQIKYAKLPKEAVLQRLEGAPKGQEKRAQFLREEFAKAGCPKEGLTDDEVKHEKQPNIVCVLPGVTPEQIVIGAHYDYVDAGDGIVDNWSGAAMLPSLLQSMANEKRQHTLVFIAFTGEEKGLLGSKSYVKKLSKEDREKVDAMINIDTLGLSPTKVWASQSSGELVNALFYIGKAVNAPVAIVDVEKVGTSDNESFHDAKIPEICIHSITQDTWHILHSRDDRLAAIKKDDYYDSYRLLAAYLALVDQEPRPKADLTGAKPKAKN